MSAAQYQVFARIERSCGDPRCNDTAHLFVVEPNWFRDKTGTTVHRAACTARSRSASYPWWTVQDMNDYDVLAAIDNTEWLRACKVCIEVDR